MKTCFKCKTEKPIDQFYRHSGMADGHLGKCKECTRADTSANREARRDYYIQYERTRTNTPARIAHLSRNCKQFRERNPEKYRAHSLVGSALRCGRLQKQPCEVCGSSPAEAHHEDYSRPLDVRWLCPTDHKARHKEMRAA